MNVRTVPGEGGETGALLRAQDWTASPLGRPETWPEALKTLVTVMLGSDQPMFVVWGSELTTLYNDGYAAICGRRHPAGFGGRFDTLWSEIWDDLKPIVDAAYAGRPTRMDDIALTMTRNGYPEEAHFAFSYTPLRDGAGAVQGFLCACNETTEQVAAQRATALRAELGDRLRTLSEPAEIMAAAAEMLGRALKADGVGYGEVDETGVFVTVAGEWTSSGYPGVSGTYAFDTFGETLSDERRTGATVRVNDVLEDPRTAAEGAQAAYAAVRLRAHLDAPVLRDGRFVAYLFVLSSTPRVWTDHEAALVEEFAARTWSAIHRRRAEAEVREREHELQLLTDALPVLISYVDRDQRYRFNNKTYETWFGRPREDIYGKTVREVLGETAYGTVAPVIDRVLAGERFSFETHLAYAAGGAREVRVEYMPRTDAAGAVEGWYALVQDISDRKQAEASLRKSEQRFRAAVDAVRGVLWTNDSEGRMSGEQPGWSSLTGQTREEYEGYGWASAVHPDDAQATVNAWNEAVAERKTFIFEHRVRTRTGDWRRYAIRAVPTFADDGSISEWVGVHTDVTEQRLAEAALRESEAHYRSTVELNPQVAWTATPEGQLDRVAERWREWTGGSGLGASWGEGLHADDLAQSTAAWLHSVTTGEPYDVEHRVKRLSGEFRWARSRASARRDENGAIVKWYGSTEDVHDRKTAEASLRESEQRFRNVADHAPMMMWVTDETGWCTYLNEAWYEFTGQTPEEAEGYGWVDATHPDDKATAHDAFVNANAARAPFRVEYRLRRKDGSYRWAIDAASPRFGPDGDFLGYVGSVLDIDERREAEDRLRSSETRLRTLTNVMPAFVWQAGPDGALTHFNARWYEYTEQTPEVALPYGWAVALHPDDAVRTAREWEAARATGASYEIEVRYRRADGVYRWYVARAEPVRDVEGAITSWMGTSVDIDDRKTAEAELKDLNETLEQRVHDRTRELIAAEDALRQAQKLEAIGQLTGGVAHDFNNLLTVIRSSADLLRRRELTEERRRRYVDAISDTADRAAKLTGQLLAFARRQALKPEVFDVSTRVKGISDMLRTVLGSRVELVLEADDGCWVEADASQLETALVNMAVNARDAMDGEGNLTVRVCCPEPEVDGGRFISITVTDTGPGVPEEVMPRLFEPFFTTKAVGKGTGLGLSQAYGFAKQSGGEIGVRNIEGGGAAFTLQLPRSSAERAESVAFPIRTDDSAQVHGRLLVVEDNAEVGEFASQLLNDLGYLTTHVPDAQAALQRLAQDPDAFDLVFSDVVMPGMGGVELGRTVRERHPNLPVVLTSGYSHVLAEDARHGFPLLHKPYSVEDLSRILRQALPRARV